AGDHEGLTTGSHASNERGVTSRAVKWVTPCFASLAALLVCGLAAAAGASPWPRVVLSVGGEVSGVAARGRLVAIVTRRADREDRALVRVQPEQGRRSRARGLHALGVDPGSAPVGRPLSQLDITPLIVHWARDEPFFGPGLASRLETCL